MPDLVELVKLRIKAGSLNPAGLPTKPPCGPANSESVARDEDALGFALPPMLKLLYVAVGNGGWGPGYGLQGLTNGAKDDLGHTAIQLYQTFRSKNSPDPSWSWPCGLLPICHWGCGIISCIDCIGPDFPMICFDPNFHDDHRSDWSDAYYSEEIGFTSWITLWASRDNLWDRLYSDGGAIVRRLRAMQDGELS